MSTLTDLQLLNLKKHKYSTTNVSILDPLFQKWWTAVIEVIPLWVAPNLLTMIGLVVNILTTLVLIYETNNATTDAPLYAWFLSAFGLFFYQTLDAIDGKQARRTNSSTPLGELFDHGCDSITTIFVSITAGCCFRLGTDPQMLFFQSIFCCALFYTTHWDAYVTGTVVFGRFDVTESQAGLIVLLIGSGIFGNHIWEYPLLLGWNIKMIVFYSCVFLGTINIGMKLYSLLQHCKESKGRPISEALSPFIPLSVYLMFVIFSINSRIFMEHPTKVIFAFQFVFSKISNVLIVSNMSKFPMKKTDLILLSPLIIILPNAFNIGFEISSYAFVITTFTDLIIYNAKICRQICDYLNIYLFKL